MKINWKFVILFIVVALGISFPIQNGYLDDHFQTLARSTIFVNSGYLLAGISPLLAALVIIPFHKDLSDKITIFGEEKLKNILILCLPVLAFSVVGIKNDFGVEESLFGFSFAAINTIYACAEEFGWRRYLQNALEPLNKNLKYILISFVWWIWHFRFESQFELFIFPFICIVGGFLLGKLTDEFKSILPVAAMHNLIILTTSQGNFGWQQIAGIIIVIAGWILLDKYWKWVN